MKSSPGIDEAVALEVVLLVVELPVAAAAREQLVVRAALDDLAAFEHQNLIGAANRRQPVRDDERRPAVAQRSQAVLDHRLALAVEARRRFVEQQDPRIGENRARDRHALALAAGQPDAALADDRLVPLLEPLDELVGVRDPADPLDVGRRRVRRAVADVLGHGAVEQEVVLQHDAEMAAVFGQPQRRQIAAVHAHRALSSAG